MSGTKTMYSQPSFAETLRREADEVNNKHDAEKVRAVYDEAIKAAKLAAKNGSYSTKVYHDNLSDSQTVKALIKKLSEQGFNCSKASEDYAYSEHARKTMLYVDISW